MNSINDNCQVKENIKNAFNVVRNTYKNVDKLMRYLDELSEECGYESKFDKFLRYSSDAYTEGWLFNSFGKIYQFKEDKELENNWRKGNIYYVEINFEDYPKLLIGQYKYDLENWGKGISPASYRQLSDVLHLNKNFNIELLDSNSDYYKSTLLNDNLIDKYWNFEEAIFKSYDLMDITSDNVEEKVFREFDKMRNFTS